MPPKQFLIRQRSVRAEAGAPCVFTPRAWPYNGKAMSILDLFLAAISLAPPGLLLLFWRMFPDDRGIHPIYRDSRSNDTQKDRHQYMTGPMKTSSICFRCERSALIRFCVFRAFLCVFIILP